MKIDVKFENALVTLGAIFGEQVVIQEIVKLQSTPQDDAIVITSVVPVQASGDALSIGGS